MTKNEDVLKKNIIIELGLEELPEDRKLNLLSRMSDLIQKRVLLRVIKSLPIEHKEQFDKLLGRGNEQEIYHFLIEKVPDIDKITDQEVACFKEEVIEKIQNSEL